MFDIRKELYLAWKEVRAVGAFNVYDLETAQAVAESAKDMDYPVIMQVTPTAIDFAGLKQIFDIVRNEINENNIKAAIHLDHGKDFGITKECVDIGFDSVMIDGSKLDYQGNLALTQKVVRYAKKDNVMVEGEIGVISREEGGKVSGKGEYTNPDLVKKFAQESGVDILAVSVGNEHGAPKGEKLDIGLLSEIGKISPVPLVMHGASGLNESDVKSAVKCGIVKLNIDTNIRKVFVDSFSQKHPGVKDPREILTEAKEEAKEIIKKYIKLLSGE